MLRAIAPLAQERMIVLSEAVGLLAFLFVDEVEIDPAAAEKQLAGADAARCSRRVRGAPRLADWATRRSRKR